MCDAARKGDLEHPLFSQENKTVFSLLALAAFKEAKLSIENFCDLLMFYTVLKYHDKKEITTVKLFTDEGRVDLAKKFARRHNGVKLST